MPRANRRRRDEASRDLARAFGSPVREQQHGDGAWFVRSVTGAATAKTYRCPGCQQLVSASQPHLVVWPADGPVSDAVAIERRRHWHSACWTARARRR